MADSRYPAKSIEFRNIDFQSGKIPGPVPGPGKWLIEGQLQISRHLKKLQSQINSIIDKEITAKEQNFINGDKLPLPIVFQMAERGLAKSRRPDTLFQRVNTEVIAIHGLGKLIVPVTREILEELKSIIIEVSQDIPRNRLDWVYYPLDKNGVEREKIKPDKIKEYELIHELTAIEKITGYSTDDILIEMGISELSTAKEDGKFKVRFFHFDNPHVDNLVLNSFISQFQSAGITRRKLERIDFSNDLNTYAVPYVDDQLIREMAQFPGVELIASFVRFTPTYEEDTKKQTVIDIIEPEIGKSYPKVAIVDSGISEKNDHLVPWVTKESFVPKNRQNNYHGDFVAGLMVYGHIANPEIQNIVDSGVHILDVVVMPDSRVEFIREDELLDALITALEKYSEEYKVWNLSVGSQRLCSGIVSDFTAALDNLQDEFGVYFVIAAGNYTKLRNVWPVEDPFEEDEDKITIPADSVRAITVGAVALNHDEFSSVYSGQVVPYSRRGPGVGLSIKPDVIHFSGNPSDYPINSLNSNGEIVSDFGTSYSTPLVSAILAEYYHLYPWELGRPLAKALLIHGSRHPITNKRINDAKDHYYYGFGLPKRLQDVIYGNEHEITLIFEGSLNYTKGRNWIQIGDFPFPQSLETNGKIRGEILVTLAYEPHLKPRLGSEYCRSNIDLRLAAFVDGKYKTITKGSAAGEVAEEQWEKMQMSKQLKWSPVKQFEFTAPRGTKGSSNVKLELYPVWRDISEKRPLNFAVVVTIRDPKGEAPVYNEVSALLLQSFQFTDLSLRYTPTRIITRQ